MDRLLKVEFPTKLPTEKPSEVVTKTNKDLQVQRLSRRTYHESRNKKNTIDNTKGVAQVLEGKCLVVKLK